MLRLAYAVVVGLFGAGIVHITILLLLPEFSDRDAWARLSAHGPPYAMTRIDGDAEPIGRSSDPMFMAAACRFDLADGLAHVRAAGQVPFWSVSVYDRGGRNIYSFNDRTASSGLDFVVVTPGQLVEVRKELPAELESSIFVEAEVGEGIAVVRAFVPDSTWTDVVSRFLAGATCVAE